jgi:hypothetical protein
VSFGEHGMGYVMFALTQSVARMEEAVERVEELF